MIRLLLVAYPRAWRRRYGQELTQLVDDIGLSPRIAADLILAGVIERQRTLKTTATGGLQMLIGPAWRHPRGLALIALVVVAPVTAFVVGSILAYQLGITSLIAPRESVNSLLAMAPGIDLFLVLSVAVAFVLALAPLIRLDVSAGESGGEAVIGIRLRLANLAVGGLALVIGGLLVWHTVSEFVLERGL